MSSIARRGLIAAVALAIAASPAVASSVAGAAPAPQARHAASAKDPTIRILTGGDRTSSASGTATGGDVNGVAGVVYRVTNGVGFSEECESTPAGCTVVVPSNGTYTVTQVSAPSSSDVAQDNYRINRLLGIGALGSITRTAYDSLQVTVPSNQNTAGETVVPMGTVDNSPNSVRSGRWAVSRFNPPPPTTCARNVALLFDLSASINAADFGRYQTAAIDYVTALRGTATNVTLFTFGTAAGTPGNSVFTGSTSTPAGVNGLVGAINSLSLPSGQFTNWDAGIWQIANFNTTFNEAIVLTDGDPTAMGSTGTPDTLGGVATRFRSIEAGIFSANALKAKGTRILAVGIDNNDSQGSIDNLQAISGPEENQDYFVIGFGELDGLLTHLALEDCASLHIAKVASPRTYNTLGQPIVYTYTVTNTSPSDGFTLSNITVHDTPFGTIDNCNPSVLPPDGVATCTFTHAITQDDLNAGSVANSAHATGQTINNDTIMSNTAPELVTGERRADIEITKVADPQSYNAPNQTIEYAYVVTNTGNVTLTNVQVTDNRITNVSCDPAIGSPLDPGGTMHCTGSHVTDQADVDAGFIANRVDTEGTPPEGLMRPTDFATEQVNGVRRTSIEITKVADPQTFNAAGDTITYNYRVQNTGNVTLRNVSVTDDTITGLTCMPPQGPGSTLLPNAVMTCSATHTVTQAEVNAGIIENMATATGTPPPGLMPPTDHDTEEVRGAGEPAIEITKVASPQTYSTVGQPITYTYTVTNTGPITLNNVTVSDDTIAGLTCTPPEGSTLAPDGVMTCTATHVITQADLDRGSIDNVATATGTPATGGTVTDTDEEQVTGNQLAGIEVTKVASPQTFDRAGQTITYTYTVTNTGNVTLNNVTLADDTIAGLTCRPPEGSTLAPEGVMTCTATHVTTQADVDRGNIANAVTATGHPETGPEVTDNDNEKISAGQLPVIEITKTPSPTTYNRHGQPITYTYRVTNAGNLTLTDITVVDNRFGTITCPQTTLAPGASMTCTAIHLISATDLDEGSIANTATATGTQPNGQRVPSVPASALVTGVRPPVPPPPPPTPTPTTPTPTPTPTTTAPPPPVPVTG